MNLAEQLRANRLVVITDREAALQSVLALVDAGIGMVEVSRPRPTRTS